MEDGDFDFDEFMENSNRDFEMKLEEYRDRMMQMAIETNYENILKNGINEYHLRHMYDNELRDLSNTFKMMLEYFEAHEEYEKCAVVLREQNKVNSVIDRKLIDKDI